jgi:DNA-binding NarL/FixJ family response regulator
MTRRALIVDDHRLFAEAVSPILERLGFEVSSAVDAREAAAQVSATRPSLIVIDIGLPGEDGLSLGRRLLEEDGDLTVIAVTAADDPGLATTCLQAGFQGFVTKDTSVPRFERAVRAALDGQAVIPKRLIPRMGGSDPEIAGSADLLARHLTPREREVLSLLVAGANGREIASRLVISANTVRTHVQSILTKLQVHSRLEAAAFAVHQGLIERPVTLGGPRSPSSEGEASSRIERSA